MTARQLRLVFSGGGTGGHIYPALSIARKFLERHPDTDILFIGANRGMEVTLVPQAGFRLETIDLTYLPRRPSLDQVRAVAKAIAGLRRSGHLLKNFSPDLVVGTGGYVAGPILLRAAVGGYPTLIHEQNAFPSLTNRLLGRFVRQIAVSHVAALQHFPRHKTVVTGNPVREEILAADRISARRALGYQPDDFVLVVVGGSGGALGINEAVCGAYGGLIAAGIQVYHVAGKRDFEMVAARANALASSQIRVTDYAQDMPELWAAADLAVSRPGSTTAELAILGVPAILIPSPIAADDHQTHNARVVADAGGALLVPESELSAESLLQQIVDLRRDTERRARMSDLMRTLALPDASSHICDLMEALLPGS